MAEDLLSLQNQLGQDVAASASTILDRCEQAGVLLVSMCERVAWIQAGHAADDAAAQDAAELVTATTARMAALIFEAGSAAGKMMASSKAREAIR